MDNVKPYFTITDSRSIPALYQYMSEEYIDQFFADGTLQLSTLYYCRNHEDLIRKDDTEGKSHFSGTPNTNGDIFDKSHKHVVHIEKEGLDPQKVNVSVDINFPNSFLLSLSDKANQELVDRFGTNTVVAITDMMGFIIAVRDAVEEYFKSKNTTMNGAPVTGQIDYTDSDEMPFDLMDFTEHAVFLHGHLENRKICNQNNCRNNWWDKVFFHFLFFQNIIRPKKRAQAKHMAYLLCNALKLILRNSI